MAIRVYQIAKEFATTPEAVMAILKDAGLNVGSATAPLDQHAVHTVRARLGKVQITLVEGEHVQTETHEPEKGDVEKPAKPKPKTRKKKAAEPEPAPPVQSMKVRVIKSRHDEEDEHKEEATAKEDHAPEESAEKPKLKPPLARPPRPLRRPADLQARIEKIHKIAEARSTEGGEEKPAAAAETRPDTRDQRRPDRPQRDRPSNDRQGPPPQGAGRTYQRGNQPSGQRPYNREGGGYRGGENTGDRPSGGGDRYQGNRPAGGGQRPYGDRRPSGPGGPNRGRDNRPQGDRNFRRPGQAGGGDRQLTTPVISEEMKMALSTGSALVNEKGPNKFKQAAAWSSNAKKKKKKKRRGDAEGKLSELRVPVSTVQLPDQELGIIMLSEGVTVKELAEKVNRTAKDVIKRLFERGIMATINHVLEKELAIDLAKDFGYLAEIVTFEEDLQMRDEEIAAQDPQDEEMLDRAPIVTVMGHVDHGKTSLLDAIRTTRVASGEAGGITQHIGAYSVQCQGKDIVFLDTPGHEAFTKMRARGASVTDIVVLVVAADDGVKPQTIEAIHHARAAKVPIIIAINKIDKPEANPDKVKLMLTEHQLVVEEFGGDSPCCLVSAKSKVGIQELLEMILLVADIQNLKAAPTRKARGTVVEAALDRGRGAVATILVQDGTLAVGDYFIAGATYGKVRAMLDDIGSMIDSAGPSTPVEILGIQEVPMAGDTFQVVADEATARQISSFRRSKMREEALRRRKHMSLDQLFSKMSDGEVKELPLIIKSDVQGSLEGITHALNQIQSEKVTVRILHQGVGNINENDVLLAMASDAIIIGFHVKAEKKAQELAEREEIDIRFHTVIYQIVEEIEQGMLGLLEPDYEQNDIGRVQVRQIFSIPKLGKIAGSYVESGYVKRDSKLRIIRGSEKIFEGEVSGLRRFKDSVAEVKSGFECGISVHGFEDFQEGDVLEIYELKEVKPEL